MTDNESRKIMDARRAVIVALVEVTEAMHALEGVKESLGALVFGPNGNGTNGTKNGTGKPGPEDKQA